MIFWLLALTYSAIEQALFSGFKLLVYISFALVLGHYFGWIERLIWFIIEKEASKIVNGTKITLGSFRLDWSTILQGKITAEISNAVLHTPEREAWGWESPLIARVGNARVEVNAPTVIIHEIFLRTKLPLEIYSVLVSDVQVFVERHDQVINVYLCDPAAVLPEPPYLDTHLLNSKNEILEANVKAEDLNSKETIETLNKELEGGENASSTHHGNVIGTQPTGSNVDLNEDGDKHKEQAQKLVNDMLHAVQSLGRAAQKGSLNSAMKQQGLEMAEKLRDGLSTRNRNTSELEQGVAFMEQVGKVAVESLKTPKLILPERNVSEGGPEPPMARIGCVLLKDIRVFTKDSWIQLANDTSAESATKYTGAFGGIGKEEESSSSLKKGNWNRPIFIETLALRASELCPSLSSKDENNSELPAVYQRIDKIVEIAWRRLLAEMAKSNGGRLFSTAVGEVLSFIKSNPHQNSKIQKSNGTNPSSTSTPTSGTTKIHVPNVQVSIPETKTEKLTPSGDQSMPGRFEESHQEVRV